MSLKINKQLYSKLKTGRIYDVKVIETHPMYEKFGNKDGYETCIRFLDENGTMTQKEVINEVSNLKRRTPGGSPITILSVINVSPVSLSDEELKRYCLQVSV